MNQRFLIRIINFLKSRDFKSLIKVAAPKNKLKFLYFTGFLRYRLYFFLLIIYI